MITTNLITLLTYTSLSDKKDCLFTWGEGPRPKDFPGLTELGL